jgi:hypothetical protein
VTVSLSEIQLDKGEREDGAPFARMPALKLAQMGVDSRFQGRGFGAQLIAFATVLALKTAELAGCRYLILDSVPGRVEYYRKHGFVENTGAQAGRRSQARNSRRDPDLENVSMRLDLRRPGELNLQSLGGHRRKPKMLAASLVVGATAFFTWLVRRPKSKR